jgi:glycosyltransferase involved in cell wall biosynthesis
MAETETFLSVVVPLYNEAARLPNMLTRLHEYLAASRFSDEILIVLDGPTDGTREVLKAIKGEISNLTVIDRTINRGNGYKVKEGMLGASEQVRLFSDAGNSTDMAHLNHMWPLFDQGYDVVIASRISKDRRGGQPSGAAAPLPLALRSDWKFERSALRHPWHLGYALRVQGVPTRTR